MTSKKDSYDGGSTSGGDYGGSDLQLGDTKSAESLVDSARSGRDEFDFGDDRAITNPPNWPSLDTHALYHSAVDNNDPGSADAMGQTWTNHGTELQRVADELYDAIAELGGVWVGQAAGAAQGSLVGIANSSQIAGDAATTMGMRMSEQAMAAAEVKKMPPPSDFTPEGAWEAALAAGPASMAGEFLWKKWHEANEIKKQQEAYLAAYTKSMSDVDSATPSFGPESLGLKPAAGHQSVVRSIAAGVASSGADIGPGLSDARARVDAAVSSVQAHAVEHAKGVAHAGGHAAAQVTQQVPGQATAAGPLSATGHAAVSTTSSGPSAAGIGAAALGAGVGLAGARALTKNSRTGRKPGAAPTAEEAAAQEAAAQEAAAQEVAAAEVAAAEASSAEAAAAQQAAAGAGAVEAAVSAMSTGEPVSGASVAASADPAPGNVAAVAQHQAGGTAAVAHGGPGGSGGPAAGGAGGAPSAAQLNAMGAMAPGPMTPMGGAGAAGVGAGGEAGSGAGAAAEHTPASFLIAPDPDEFFGTDEAVTPTVIGAFDDDDE